MKIRTIFFLLLIILVISGCGKNVGLSGKVTFSDDNSPLTFGEVCFRTDTFLARGTLKNDGTYTVGSLTKTDGIPPGVYQVYITGAVKELGLVNIGTNKETTIIEQLIDEKYGNPEKSGLTVEVKKSTTFNIQVDRYVPKKKK
jgi:hypothetical protein